MPCWARRCPFNEFLFLYVTPHTGHGTGCSWKWRVLTCLLQLEWSLKTLPHSLQLNWDLSGLTNTKSAMSSGPTNNIANFKSLYFILFIHPLYTEYLIIHQQHIITLLKLCAWLRKSLGKHVFRSGYLQVNLPNVSVNVRHWGKCFATHLTWKRSIINFSVQNVPILLVQTDSWKITKSVVRKNFCSNNWFCFIQPKNQMALGS